MQRELLTVLLCLVCSAGANASRDGSGQVEAARTGANHPPAISGSPIRSIVAGEFYEFMPKASDADGHTLLFSIARKPRWAAFSTKSGRLYGTPKAADVGAYSNVTITVSDGRTTTALPAFGIAVNQQGDGSVTLSWMPPTENEDGSALKSLAGFRIYYGRSADNLDRVIVLNNPGLNRYLVEGLSSARWYFAMTSIGSGGAESKRTKAVSKLVG